MAPIREATPTPPCRRYVVAQGSDLRLYVWDCVRQTIALDDHGDPYRFEWPFQHLAESLAAVLNTRATASPRRTQEPARL